MCTNGSGVIAVIDLSSQIVTVSTATANASGPGGLRQAIDLDPGPAETDSFNLASIRSVSYATGGTKVLYFKFAKNRMDAGTSCIVFYAAFSVVFVPS